MKHFIIIPIFSTLSHILARLLLSPAQICWYHMVRILSAQWKQFLVLKFPVKEKCASASSVHSIRKSHLSSSLYLLRKKIVKSTGNCLAPDCNIWKHWNRQGNIRRSQRRTLRTAVLGKSKLRAAFLIVCERLAVTVWCTSAITRIGTDGRLNRGLSQIHPVASKIFLSIYLRFFTEYELVLAGELVLFR